MPPGAAASEAAQERININTASAAKLAELPGIGPVRAAQIVRMRERNGSFRCVEELRAVPRLPEKDFQKLRKRVTVGSGSKESGGCRSGAPPPAQGKS